MYCMLTVSYVCDSGAAAKQYMMLYVATLAIGTKLWWEGELTYGE